MAVNGLQLMVDYAKARIEIYRLRVVVSEAGDFGYRMGYVVGAAKHGTVIIRPEDVEVPKGK